jgi:hypothetical protein
MTSVNFKKAILESIKNGDNLMVQRDILIQFRDSGGTKKKAMIYLEDLRTNASNEILQDILLEIMDFASGWCKKEMIVFED